VKQIARKTVDSGKAVLVLDPSPYKEEWEEIGASFVSDNPQEFLQVVFANKQCMVIVDESGDMIGRYGGEMNQLATRGRHMGHQCYFITQRAKQIDTTVRANCENIIIFKQSLNDTKDLANEFVDPMLNEAHTLEKLEYIYKIGDNSSKKGKVIFDS
jgi:hypothetical protein